MRINITNTLAVAATILAPAALAVHIATECDSATADLNTNLAQVEANVSQNKAYVKTKKG